jgi:cysteine-rich repeat protein
MPSNRIVSALVAAMLVAVASGTAVASPVVAGRLIVKLDDALASDVAATLASDSFRAQAPDTTLDALVRTFDVRAARRLFAPRSATLAEARARLAAAPDGRRRAGAGTPLVALANVWVLELPPAADLAAAAAAFAADPHVLYAHADPLGEAAALPNDPLLTCDGAGCEPADPKDPAWGTWQWALHRIGAPAAWERATGAGVVVAFIDSGVNRSHADMGTVWTNDDEPIDGADSDGNGFVDDFWGWDFVTCNRFDLSAPNLPTCSEAHAPDNDPSDEEGHGTAVAAILGAETDNTLLMAGVAYDARVMVLRAVGNDLRAASSEVMAALVYAAANGADIVSMSLVVPFSAALQEAVAAVAAMNVLQVAAAGNSGDGTLFYPASFTDVVAVASTNAHDGASDFSTFHAGVEMSAPGDNVLSLLGLGPGASAVHGGLFGTSMATPHVSGAAALLWSWEPDLTAAEVRAGLCAAAVDLGTPGRDPHYGCGRVDAVATVQTACVQNLCGDGLHEPACGEQCDDGNLDAGDCCSAACELEGVSAECRVLDKAARRCQEAIASRGRAFATTLYKALQACLKRFQKDLGAGKSTRRAAAACRKALAAGEPGSTLARARDKAASQIGRTCAGVPPAAVGPPCDPDALTMASVIACVLDGHAGDIGTMIARESRDACAITTVLGLAGGLPGVCFGP